MMSSENFYLQQNLTTEALALQSTFAGLATIAVICRFAARLLKRTALWWDDWTALLALIWLWCFYALDTVALWHGLGRHVETVSQDDLLFTRKLHFWLQITYTLAPLTVKISALLLYKRVFVISGFVKYTNGMLYVMAAWGVASLFVAIFNCSPVEAFWTLQGTCIYLRDWVYAYGSINIVLDFIVWLMPIPRVWQLQLSLHQRVSVTIIFVLGLADCAAAIARLVVAASLYGLPDWTWNLTFSGWWCVIHPSLGIIAIYLPTMRVLLVKFGDLLGISQRFSSVQSRTKTSFTNRRARWIQGERQYDELDDARVSLTGHVGRDIHRNAIALASRLTSNDTIEGPITEHETRVIKEVDVQTARPLEFPKETYMKRSAF